MIERPSANFDDRSRAIDMLVLHYTGMESAQAALDHMCDPAAKVSAHYLVDEAGEVTALVPEDKRAWHAGAASWAGVTDINGCSIGIEIANPGHESGSPPYAAPQMAALEALAGEIVARHGIARLRVLGHSDVAPLRKRDPGERFDWRRLARAGIGAWPDKLAARAASPGFSLGDTGEGVGEFQKSLTRFGYAAVADGAYGDVTQAIVVAFQRHWRPANVDGVADGQTRAILRALQD
jgi:N-acetylmuramoyl-L-alanine amidase